MLKHAGWLLLAMTLVACTAGEDGEMDADTPPAGTEDPDTPDTPDTPSTPPATPPSETNAAPVITTETITGQEGTPLDTTLRATDEDGDTLSFSLVEGPNWLRIGAGGSVNGTPGGLDIGEDPITVSASDGTDTTEAEIDLEIAYDPIEQALRTGDYTFITEETELTPPQAFFADIERIREQNNDDLAAIFQLGGNGQALANSLTNVTWHYGERARFYAPGSGGAMPLIYANTDANGDPFETEFAIAIKGRHETARFAVLGENPFRQQALDETAVNDDMQGVLENLTAWLLNADPQDGFNVVLAQLAEGSTFPDQSTTRDWLTETFGDAVSYNTAGSCDGAALDACISDDTGLIILSQEVSSSDKPSEITARVEQALNEGIPVLYVHSRTNINTIESQILGILGLSNAGQNTLPRATLGFSPVDVLADWQPDFITEYETLVKRIEDDDIDYDISLCGQYWPCIKNSAFNAEVAVPLQNLRTEMNVLHNLEGGTFPTPTAFRWYGLLALTGDYYRSLTTYPIAKTSASSLEAVRSIFGDVTSLIARDINPTANLGTFGRSEFPAHLRTDKTVEMTTQRPFRTTGVYAIPGETVTVTRTDESDVVVSLKVHSIRDGANAPFRNADAYDRPIILASRNLTIDPGETLTFTSAYGGPVHAFFSVTGEDISFDFENVGEHPIWRGPEDSSTFLNALGANEYDWAEFVTPYFEVHSTRTKMLQTLDRPYTSTPSELADMTETYIRDWPHWFAGVEGPGISQNADLRAFANTHGLTIQTIDVIKHMNADRPHCNSGTPNCAGTSGNPYDAQWFFDPIFIGDLHELGHGLEFRSRHHFEGGDTTHSTTNLYSFHTSYRYYQDTGSSSPVCWTLPYESLYSTIQNSRLRADPGQYMRDANLSSFSQQMAMFVQLLAALETQGVFDDGWLMMPRLNLVTREFSASNNDTAWAEKADGLGFGGMDRETAFSLSQNDWLLIALSWSAQRDLRAYLDMWGYIYSDDALAHVASLGLPSLQSAYYGIDSRGHCFGLTHNELPIDGRTAFSTSSASAKVAAFIPDYYTFSQHEHSEMCSLGDHIEDPS